jgi:hemoglobin-like flavoprotein
MNLPQDERRGGIEDSFDAIEQPADKRFSDEFYRHMFERFPELKERFTGVMMAHQGALLMAALGVIARNHQKPRTSVNEYLKVLGHRHYQHGISAEDYGKFQTSLLETLAKYLGPRWNDALEDEWRRAMQAAVDTMLQGHREGQVVY